MELCIEQITKTFGKKQAANQLSFTVKQDITGLSGPNGAGKITLMKILSTLALPTIGHVYYNGVDIVKQPNAIRKVVGYR